MMIQPSRLLAALACSLVSVHPALAGTDRDPWLWPFAANSIWNTPIGSHARYAPAGFEAAGHVGVDVEYHLELGNGDPLTPLYAPRSFSARCGPGTSFFGRLPLPAGFVLADAAPPDTPNNVVALRLPDRRTVKQIEPGARCQAGGPMYGYLSARDVDLYGDGIEGSHYGSGLSGLGGTLRRGELLAQGPITHVLKVNVWAKKYLAYTSSRPGWRWPATNADGYASPTTYGGRNPELVMGSLLALKPWLTPGALGITTPVGRKLFDALRDYGAYVVDDTAWDQHALVVESGVPEEIAAAHGLDMASGPLAAEINTLFRHLSIVVNNGKASVGGGGRPRAPRAPPLRAVDDPRQSWQIHTPPSGHPPALLVDGDETTKWISSGVQKDNLSITIDLGTSKTVYEVTLDAGADEPNQMRGFDVYVSATPGDPGTWVGGIRSEWITPRFSRVNFNPVPARYVTIRSHNDHAGRLAIAEIKVH